MHVIKRFLLIFTLFCLLQFPAVVAAPAAKAQDPVAELMSRMSVEDKVGQLFIVPFVGTDANPGSEVWQLITEYKVGGIILLAANSNFNNDESAPRQIAELNNTLKTTAFHTNGIPLFIAIDHEGDGFPFTRITWGATPIPSQMAIGATWDPAKAEAIGQIVGEELSAMGINLLLGPNLDVLNDPRPAGRGDIGIRVFGGDPYWVSQLGRAYIRGVHSGSAGRVAAVAKHFPGHGGSDRLPDNEVATVDKSLQELRRIELPPFFHITAELPDDPLGRADALMSSHIRYRGFQGGDIRQFTAPISFDAKGMRTLTNLPEIVPWREDGGLIVSDALGVPAVRKHFEPSLQSFPHRRIAKEAFLAGNDVLSLVQFDLKSIWSDQFANIKDTIFFFRTEYINNPAFAAQVDAAVARILRLKLKLYPQPSLDALNVDPGRALEVASQPRPVVNEIARESLTLLYPSPEELRLRIPEPPRPDEKILIVVDSRFTRECYLASCEPIELYLPRLTIEETILRLYGPGATGQIQPENIQTITFSELKLALGGAIVPLTELAEEQPENQAVQLSADEVRARIQEASWLIFAALDLNVSRFSDSDALKLFLSQESGVMRNKTAVVLAFNAPYYLDSTEVTKLTAYYGVYSKTLPHIEVAVRALFGEISASGASPVSVEGIGYKLVDMLAPNPNQDIPVSLAEGSPQEEVAPVTVTALVGPVLDRNGNPVPDDTPVELQARLNGRTIDSDVAPSRAGRAEISLTLTEPGQVQLAARADQAITESDLIISVEAPPTPTPTPVTPTPTPTLTPTPPPTATTPPTVEPTPTLVPSAEPLVEPPPPQLAGTVPPAARSLDGVDLLTAIGATLLAGLLGFWLGQQYNQPLSRRVHLGLWVLIGGLLAYLLYGVGWLRPEQWLFEGASESAGRISVAALAFIFALAALLLTNGGLKAKGQLVGKGHP
jgi:beta-N-acetylhexosaminidase